MKTLFLLLSFCVLWHSSAQTNPPAVRLAGIVNESVWKALLEVVETEPQLSTNWLTLAEGERATPQAIEVLKIDPDKQTVQASVAGNNVMLAMETSPRPGEQFVPYMQVDRVALQQVINLYAKVKNRTVLQHPALKNASITMVIGGGDAAQVCRALEAVFRLHGIVAIPDGEKFVMLVPAELAKTATPRSNEIPVPSTATATNGMMAAGLINFSGASPDNALRIDANLRGRTLVSEGGSGGGRIYLRSMTPLSKDEAVYAIETLLAWSGLRLEFPDDQTMRAVPMTADRASPPK